MSATHRKPNQYESLLAGIIAGGVEGAATYPAEFVKTRAQFTASKGSVSAAGGLRADPPGRWRDAHHQGDAAKTGHTRPVLGRRRADRRQQSEGGHPVPNVRLGEGSVCGRECEYERPDTAETQGKMTPGRTVLAGLAAGVVEAIVAVTPSETIKYVPARDGANRRTKLIQDASSTRLYHNMVDGTIGICRTEGFKGIYRGLWPTVSVCRCHDLAS
jgi:solute carrier family 25 citrate transporter 1